MKKDEEIVDGEKREAALGVRCARLSCVHHQYQVMGETGLPGRCTVRHQPEQEGEVCDLYDGLGQEGARKAALAQEGVAKTS